MSTTSINIDAGMYSLFIDDSANNCQILTGIFTQDKIATPSQTELEKATIACEAIISGAKLCNIPLIAELARSIEKVIRILISDNLELDDDTYIIITNSILIMSNLNETDYEALDDWYNNKQPAIETNINHLKGFTEANNKNDITPEPQTEIKELANSTSKPSSDLELDESMLELFTLEAEAQTQLISEKLLELENEPNNESLLEPLMRASHSLKGAARMIGFDHVVNIAHGMEDNFVSYQKGSLSLNKNSIDTMLYCNDILTSISKTSASDLSAWVTSHAQAINKSISALTELSNGQTVNLDTLPKLDATSPEINEQTPNTGIKQPIEGADASIRIQSNRLNKIMGISNEILVSHNWVQSHLEELQLIKKRQTELALAMEALKHELEEIEIPDKQYASLLDVSQKAEICRQSLNDQINHTDEFDRRSYILSSKLNQEVIASRMRPFREGAHGFQRMVRDISNDLEKKIQLDLLGLDTLIDSDILDKIEAPLTHLIRNAMDHGIESPEVRKKNNKSQTGNITVHAYHNSGSLIISIVDDGKGVDLDALRRKIISKNRISEEMANQLSESEALDFLFLPGFSTRDDVTEYSGRGVGLDVVHSVVTELRGQIRCKSKLNQGMSIELQLPLTLSVLRTLMTRISGEYYAFPLARINTILKISSDDIFTIENKQFVRIHDKDVGLIDSSQILGYSNTEKNNSDILNIVILNDRNEHYALIIDEILDKQELALRTIDSRLGKIKDVSAAAISDDGLPVMILDIDDMFISINELINNKQLDIVKQKKSPQNKKMGKRVLVIDDSLTVREVEKKLIESKGYEVDIAIDGADGWNTVRSNEYDLVITDIDMPRMNGIELVKLIKQDANLNSIPIMIVSYKDNPEDRRNGLDAGADYYLTKGSFHDESLIEAVIDLIGEAQE